MPDKSKSKKRQRADDAIDDASTVPVADMTGSATSAASAAQAAAAQAQQLAEQSEANGGNFNVFDQPTAMPDTKTQRSDQEDTVPGSSGAASQPNHSLMQLADATSKMASIEAKRRLLNERAGPDGRYVGAESSYLPAQDQVYPPAPPATGPAAAESSATAAKKRKRASDNGQPSSKATRRAVTIYRNANDEAAPPEEFPTHGPFTMSEKAIVEDFAEQFKAEHNMTDSYLADLVQSKDRKMDDITRGFWTQIYGIIPNRDNKAMQRHVRRRFHNYEQRGKWSAEDDENLKQAFEDKPNQWTKIGEALNRMPEDCRDRWRNYVVCGDSRKVDQWDPDEEARLSEAVHELIYKIKEDARAKANEEKVAFREDQDWTALINFNIVSEKLDHQRSRIQCLQHWKAMQIREQEGREKRRMKRPHGSAPLAKAPRIGKNLETARQHWLQMKAGDKHTILREILESDAYDENKISWPLILQRSPLKFWNAKDREYLWEKTKKLLKFSENSSFRERIGEALDYYEQMHAEDLDQYYQPAADPRRAEAAELQKEALNAIENGQSTEAIVEKAKQQKKEHRKADRQNASSSAAAKRRKARRLGPSSAEPLGASDGAAEDEGDEEMADAIHDATEDAQAPEELAEEKGTPNIDPRLDEDQGTTAKKPSKKRGRPSKDKGGIPKKAKKKSIASSSKKFKSADTIDDIDEQSATAPMAQMTAPSRTNEETATDAVERLNDAKLARNMSDDEDSNDE